LLITDVGLPGMTGVELTLAIRAWEKTNTKNPLPIVGLTGYTRKIEQQQFIQSGMNKILQKPAGPEIIQSTLEEFVFNQGKTMAETCVGDGAVNS
ncbi:MAG: response regulator, partial [Silvanigrellaceae bacterium]|nr:response regulator [Silvanigrellaceae bacterium]